MDFYPLRRRLSTAAPTSKRAGSLRVRLIENPDRPTTRVERASLAVLSETGEAPFDTLVGRVAAELYREEIRGGAWAVDLGLLGSRLFIPDVVRSLDRHNGVLWEIVPDPENQDGVLSDLR